MMNGLGFFNGREFRGYWFVNKEVNTIAAIEFHVFIFHRKWYLSSKRNLANGWLVTEALFICRFQKAGAKQSVHLNGSTNDLFCEFLVKQITPRLRASAVNCIFRVHVCNTPTLNSVTFGFSDAASSAVMIALRDTMGYRLRSSHKRAAT